MQRIPIYAGALLLSVFSMQVSGTTEEKIAVIDVERVIQEYDAARVAEARLEERAREYSREREQMMQQYNELQRAFEVLRDESFDQALTEKARQERRTAAEAKMHEIAEYEQKIRTTAGQRRQQLEQQRQRIFTSLLDTIRVAVRRQAEADDVTLVLDASEVTGSVSAVLYHQPGHDMTDAVIERLNAATEQPQFDEEAGVEPEPVSPPDRSGLPPVTAPAPEIDRETERVLP